MADSRKSAATATGRERTTIAAVDITPPGVAPISGVFAFRAGDEIPPAWVDQHREYLDQLGEDNGSPVYRTGTLADAPQIAEEARGAASPQP